MEHEMETKDLLAKLAALYPAAFFLAGADRKPLKLGVHRDLAAAKVLSCRERGRRPERAEGAKQSEAKKGRGRGGTVGSSRDCWESSVTGSGQGRCGSWSHSPIISLGYVRGAPRERSRRETDFGRYCPDIDGGQKADPCIYLVFLPRFSSCSSRSYSLRFYCSRRRSPLWRSKLQMNSLTIARCLKGASRFRATESVFRAMRKRMCVGALSPQFNSFQ